MGAACSTDTVPQANSNAPGKKPAAGGLPAAQKIDTAALEDRRAELQKQIDAMERQLAASRVAFDREQERQKQIRSNQSIAEQQNTQKPPSGGQASPRGVAVSDTEDPALLALQSPKHPGDGKPPLGRERSSSGAAGAASPQQTKQLVRASSSAAPAPAPAPLPSPTKTPIKLNPLRQGSGSGAALLNPPARGAMPTTKPLPEVSNDSNVLRRSSTTLPGDKTFKGEAEKKLLKPSSSKQDQLDMMRGLGGNTKLQRTNSGVANGSNPAAAAGGDRRAAAAAMSAGVAANMKRVQGLSNNKGGADGSSFLSRVPLTKLRSLNADDLKEIWDHYDADGNGYLDRDELKKLATECVERTLKMFADQLREANPNISEEQLKKEVDKERYFLLPGKGDGKRDQTQDMIRMLVQKLDINKDGQVSRAELMMQWNSFSSDLFKERTAEGSLDCTIM